MVATPLLFGLLFGATNVASADARPTLVVAPLRALGVKATEAQIMTSELRTQAVRAGRYTVVAPEDMESISAELERQLAGGCDETSCIAELGGALGAHFLITGTLGRLGKRYTVNLKLIDIEEVRAVRTERLRAESIETLLARLPDAVFALQGLAVAGRPQEGKGRLVISLTGLSRYPEVSFYLDKQKLGTSTEQSQVRAEVPAGEGAIRLYSYAKLVEVLAPADFPASVVGESEDGVIIQVPSGETLHLTARLGYTEQWLSQEQLIKRRIKGRRTGKRNFYFGAALGAAVALVVYGDSEGYFDDYSSGASASLLVGSLVGGSVSILAIILGGIGWMANR